MGEKLEEPNDRRREETREAFESFLAGYSDTTQVQWARFFGVTPGAVSNWKKGSPAPQEVLNVVRRLTAAAKDEQKVAIVKKALEAAELQTKASSLGILGNSVSSTFGGIFGWVVPALLVGGALAAGVIAVFKMLDEDLED